MQNTIETMKSLTFGTELEYTGIARQVAAKAIQSVIGGRVRFTGGAYDAWEVTATDGSGKRSATVPWKTAAAKW